MQQSKQPQKKFSGPIDVAFNSKTKTFGTLVGVPDSPNILPFRNMSKRQREITINGMFPISKKVQEYLDKGQTDASILFVMTKKDIIAGRITFNPVLFGELLAVVNVEVNGPITQGTEEE